jgi:hypothetical protein
MSRVDSGNRANLSAVSVLHFQFGKGLAARQFGATRQASGFEMNPSEFEKALASLGVTEDALSVHEREMIDRQGYVVIPGTIDREWREDLCRAFEQTAGEELAGQPAMQGEHGTRIVPNLLRRGNPVKRLFTHPKLLAAAFHVLKRPFRLSDVHGREPQRGFG